MRNLFLILHIIICTTNQLHSQNRIDTVKFAYIKGGKYVFKNLEERQLCLNKTDSVLLEIKDFYISKTELTVSEFAEFVEESHYKTDAEKKVLKAYILSKEGGTKISGKVNWRYDAFGRKINKKDYNLPVLFLSIRDIENYCGWAGVRLPKEEEWEYAAKKGIEGMESYYWSHLPDYAWYGESINASIESQPHKVGLKKPNQFGVYDLSANVAEVCIEYCNYGYIDESSKNILTSYSAKGGIGYFDIPRLYFENKLSIPRYPLFFNIGYRMCKDKL